MTAAAINAPLAFTREAIVGHFQHHATKALARVLRCLQPWRIACRSQISSIWSSPSNSRSRASPRTTSASM